jgi:hypothetical protein
VKWRKDDKGFFRVCITSRPRKREFLGAMERIERSLITNKTVISSYFAGKYDGDGSYWKTRLKFKITYGKPKNINFDKKLLLSIGISSKIRKYKNANAFDLEISSGNALTFFDLIREHSIIANDIINWNVSFASCIGHLLKSNVRYYKCPLGTTEFVS